MSRIVSDPQILGGKPCIRGTRISVEMILEWIASGASRADILRSYPHLAADDVDEALRYAVQSVNHEVADAEIAAERVRRGGQAHFAPKTAQNEPVPEGSGAERGTGTFCSEDCAK